MNESDLPPTRGYSDPPQGEVCPPVQTGGGVSLKTCRSCHSELPLSAFCLCHKRTDGKHGRDSHCKLCRALAQRKKHASLSETQRTALRATKRAWQDKHPHAAQARWSNQHARYLGVKGTIHEQDVDAVWLEYSGRCWVCKDVATQLDHFRPLNKVSGGENTADNIRPICRECNQKRSHLWHGAEIAEKEAALLRQLKDLLKVVTARRLGPDVGETNLPERG